MIAGFPERRGQASQANLAAQNRRDRPLHFAENVTGRLNRRGPKGLLALGDGLLNPLRRTGIPFAGDCELRLCVAHTGYDLAKTLFGGHQMDWGSRAVAFAAGIYPVGDFVIMRCSQPSGFSAKLGGLLHDGGRANLF